jgi:REP element-mobilizing transposase RayT
MKHSPDIHHRRSIRLQEYDYSLAGACFVTICAQNRTCLFGNVVDGEMRLSPYGRVAQDKWNELPTHYPNAVLDTFVVMPNHIHGIIVISVGAVGAIHESPLQPPLQQPMDITQRRLMLLPKIVGRFKMNSAKRINEMRGTSGLPVWQRNYYEPVIRNDKSLNKIREYIINNPAQWEFDRENPVGAIHESPLQSPLSKDEPWLM